MSAARPMHRGERTSARSERTDCRAADASFLYKMAVDFFRLCFYTGRISIA